MSKDMDSVFANCTDKELAFDVMFDSDDSLIDAVAGVDEAGDPVTGPDFVYKEQEELDALSEADEDTADSSDETEDQGNTDVEEGCKKESAAPEESTADQTPVDESKEEETVEESTEEKVEEAVAPEESTADQTPVDESTEEEVVEEDSNLEAFFAGMDSYINKMTNEATSVCPCCGKEYCDCAEREGKAKEKVTDVEGQTLDPVGVAAKGNPNADTIEDNCDTAERQGEVKHDTKNIEGITNEPVSQDGKADLDDGEGKDKDVKPEEEDDKSTDDTVKAPADEKIKLEEDADLKPEGEDEKAVDDTVKAPADVEIKLDESVKELLADILSDTEEGILDKLPEAEDHLVKDNIDDVYDKAVVNKISENTDEAEETVEITEDTDFEESSIKEDAAVDKEVEKVEDEDELDDDDLIELINTDADASKSDDVEVDYDDDELIDMVLSGKVD